MEDTDPQAASPEVKEPRKTARSRVREKTGKEKSLLLMELSEIKEISDIIFEKIEKQIDVLKTIEASVDQKIAVLKKLKEGEEAPEKQPDEADRLSEIRSLRRKGLGIREIADVLKIPAGEIELMINLDQTADDVSDPATLRQREPRKLPERQARQKTGTRFLSSKIVWGFLALFLLAAIVAFLFLRQWEKVPLTASPKSEHAVIEPQPLPASPLPVPTPPVAEEKRPDIDSIRKQYSSVSETEVAEQEGPSGKERIARTKNRSLPAPNPAKQGTTVTILTHSATVRTEPNLKSDPVAWVSKGDVLEVKEYLTDRSGRTWNRVVTADGREGWIASSVVKPSS